MRLLDVFRRTPQAAGPAETLRQFTSTDQTISRDLQAGPDGTWSAEVQGEQTIPLFQVEGLEVDQALLTFRAQLRCDGLTGGAYLEMWCRLPGRGEFFSKGFEHTIKGTTNWATYEVPFFLKKGEQPDLVKLNLVVSGQGTVEIKEIELLRTPLTA